jgi:hypothetical protein
MTLARAWILAGLIDKTGVVRRVHLGGTIAPEGADIDAITADIERLLAQ